MRDLSFCQTTVHNQQQMAKKKYFTFHSHSRTKNQFDYMSEKFRWKNVYS